MTSVKLKNGKRPITLKKDSFSTTLQMCKAKSSEVYEYNANWYNNRNSTNKTQCCGTKYMQCDPGIRTLKIRNQRNQSAIEFATIKSYI